MFRYAWAYEGAVECCFPESIFISVYFSYKEMVFNCFLYVTTHVKAHTDMNNSCKGPMEREVAVYSEGNLPGDTNEPLLGTLK